MSNLHFKKIKIIVHKITKNKPNFKQFYFTY